jgi:hypothetical protein
MISSSVFSGKLTTTVNGAPAKNFSYDGSMSTKDNKLSFDVATDMDGVKNRLALKDVAPQGLQTNPKFIEFMKKMNGFRKIKKTAVKRKRARKTKRS